MPVTDYLRKKLLARDIVHADETPVQVLKEDGKKPQTKSYMWVYRTGNDGKEPIVLFDYQPSRSGDNAATYLKDFKGYVHSDGYSGYNKLTEVTRCGCWAHYPNNIVIQEKMLRSRSTPAFFFFSLNNLREEIQVIHPFVLMGFHQQNLLRTSSHSRLLACYSWCPE